MPISQSSPIEPSLTPAPTAVQPSIAPTVSQQPDSHQPNDRLVSVIIPAYNADRFIERTLRSVLAQTHRLLEVLVINDGSTDRTVELVQAIAAEDSRVRLLHQANAGVAAARNLGIQQATGDWIAPIDADDLWFPQHLAAQLEIARTDPEAGVIYAWSIDIDEQDQPIGGFCAASVEGRLLRTLVCHNFIGNASATLLRRSLLEQAGGYDTQLRAQAAQGCEDWDLYVRLAALSRFRVSPQFSVGYRKVSSSMSGDFSQMAKSHQLMLQAVRQRSPEVPDWLCRLSSSSFYLYLARQSSYYQRPEAALGWLAAALRIDPITPWLRLGLYQIALKSWRQRGQQPVPPDALSLTPSLPTQDSPIAQDSLPEARSPASLSLWLKLGVGAVLHRCLTL